MPHHVRGRRRGLRRICQTNFHHMPSQCVKVARVAAASSRVFWGDAGIFRSLESHDPAAINERNDSDHKTLPQWPGSRIRPRSNTTSSLPIPRADIPTLTNIILVCTGQSHAHCGSLLLDLGTLSLELCEKKRTRATFCAAQLTTAPHSSPLLFPVLILIIA